MQRRLARGLEMQNQLVQAQEDLKKAKDQLAATEEEKFLVMDELKEMKKVADDANLGLSVALSAQKHAEEGWKAEKIRAQELEQASIGMAQKRDQAWQLELEAVQRQHALDVETLSSVEQELIRIGQELSIAIKTRDEALKEAVVAKRSAEANHKRVNDLSKELQLMKESINSDSSNLKGELDPEEAAPMIELLKHEFNKEKHMEAQLAERESLIENLKLEVKDAKEAEAQALNQLSEIRARLETTEQELEKAKASEMRTSESLVAQTKELDKTKMALEEAKFEVASLHETVRSLETSIGQSSKDLTVSRRSLEIAKLDTRSVKEVIRTLKFELQTAREDLGHAQEREALALSDSHKLAEEINVLRNELKVAKEAEEKDKATIDSIAQTLQEAKEKLEPTKIELQNAKKEIENTKTALKKKEKKFQELMDDARREVDRAKEEVERLKSEKTEEFHDACNGKEVGPIQCKKMYGEETVYMKEEGGTLIESLLKADEIANKAREETRKLRDILRQAVNDATVEKEAVELARAENSQLKDNLSDLGSSLHSMTKENRRLKIKEAAALEQVKELKGLLNATPKNESEVSQKPNIPAEEPRDSKKTEKLPAEQSKEEQINDAEHENPSTSNGSKDDDEDDPDDILKGSIFNLTEDDMTPNFSAMTHRKALSVFMDDRDMLDADDFDANHFDDTGFERSSATRQRKKKALLYRFGDLLKRRTYLR